ARGDVAADRVALLGAGARRAHGAQGERVVEPDHRAAGRVERHGVGEEARAGDAVARARVRRGTEGDVGEDDVSGGGAEGALRGRGDGDAELAGGVPARI